MPRSRTPGPGYAYRSDDPHPALRAALSRRERGLRSAIASGQSALRLGSEALTISTSPTGARPMAWESSMRRLRV